MKKENIIKEVILKYTLPEGVTFNQDGTTSPSDCRLLHEDEVNDLAEEILRVIYGAQRKLASDILKRYEDSKEYHLHSVDREWVLDAMLEFSSTNK
jgi:hypothetical protein